MRFKTSVFRELFFIPREERGTRLAPFFQLLQTTNLKVEFKSQTNSLQLTLISCITDAIILFDTCQEMEGAHARATLPTRFSLK